MPFSQLQLDDKVLGSSHRRGPWREGHMLRREFMRSAAVLTLVSVTCLRVVRAQLSTIYRAGYLGRMPYLLEPPTSGLRRLGYVEGRNLKVEYGFGGGGENLNALAAQLVAFGPDAIKSLGLTLSPALLARAHEVIE